MNRRGPMNDAIRMQISAFVDGELPQNEAELLLRRMCQDRDLRQQAAEYLAMGRVMRGERSLSGAGKLRERISAALDDQSLQADIEIPVTSAPRFLRPVAGVAIAATVALAALLGLQQILTDPEGDLATGGEPVAGARGVTEPPVTEPPVAEPPIAEPPNELSDEMWQYHVIHSSGSDNIESRLDSLQRRGDAIGDTEEMQDDDAEPESDAGLQTP